MTAKALLDKNPTPDDSAINDALAGTFCRCTGHVKIKEAITNVAGSKVKATTNGS